MRFALSRCLCVESFNPEHTYTYTGFCVVTGKSYSVTVKASELYAYHQGELAQNAFKSLSAADREFLISAFWFLF